MPRSIRGRMTVTALAVFAVVLLIGSVALSLTVPALVRAELVDRADRASRQVTTLIDERPLPGPVPPQHDVLLLQVVDTSGRVVAASAALQGRPPLTAARPAGGDSRVSTRVCPPGADACLIVVGTSNRSTAYGPAVAYAAVRESLVLRSAFLPLALAGSSLVLLALVGWGAWTIVGRVLAPVERIRAGLEQISATDLSERMPVPGTGDEVAELAITVNDTLCRLEDAVERHRRFVSDASHELRTPLTAMLVGLESGLDHPDRATVKSALDDATRLSAIVQDLLLMARLDAGERPAEDLLDLGALVAEEVARRPFRLEVETSVTSGLKVRGDRLRLDRLLTNLLANADRYGEAHIWVSVSRDGDQAVVEVMDDGPGIPADLREQVFQRFTRLDRGRSRDTGGTGLGLPIARDIAEAHGGTLQAADTPEGAHLILHLPLAERDSSPGG
ncbi:sensor histidine kinase [Nonomuraea sp. NPDC050790]|uniref:sensor histidine kinase n=1 Tax=Nonomuraea sp. NPDC050790 TaxID=3364371 RepID=UPI0037993E28